MGFIKVFYKRLRLFLKYHLMLFANHILFFFFINEKAIDAKITFSLLVSYVLIGMGGFLLNDFYDRESDIKAGKINSTTKLNKYLFWAILILLWFISALILYNLSIDIFFIILIQFLLLFLYSHPSIRLKEKSFWGLIIDATYAHFLPLILLMVLFYNNQNILLIVALIFFNWILGIKDILIHQQEDLEKDIQAGINTYTTYQPIKSNRLLNKVHLLLMALFNLFLIAFLIQHFSWLNALAILTCILFMVYQLLIGKNAFFKNNLTFKTYVCFISVLLLDWLLQSNQFVWMILLAHPFFISFLITIKNFLAFGFNYLLYYLFLPFGRNLKNKPFYKK